MYDVELIDVKDEWVELVKRVKAMSKDKGNSVEIGVFEDPGLVKIATENEFGDPPRPKRKWRIPERSFLRHVFDRDKKKLAALMQKGAGDIITGKAKTEKVLEYMGSLFEKNVKDFIISGYYKSSKPNHPITIKIKGNEQPLIQIGKVYSTLTHRITGKAIKIKK